MVIFRLLPCLVIASCVAASDAAPKSPLEQAGVDESALDPKAKPCDDFYQYACGGWVQKTEIPADKPAWDRSFSALQEENLATLRKILDELAQKPSPAPSDEPYADKLAAYWSTCMNEPKIEASEKADLASLLGPIDRLKSVSALPKLLAELHLRVANPIFTTGSQQDLKDASQVIGSVDQGGLSLPDRDYYLLDDEQHQQVRAQFTGYVVDLLGMTGVAKTEALRQAKIILRLETALARASLSRVDRRDPKKTYHRLERQGLIELAPRFDWKTYFTGMGFPDITQINVVAPDFFKAVNLGLQKTPLADWKVYLRWHVLNPSAPLLSKRFVDRQFAFYGKTLQGTSEIEPRWKRCVAAVDGALGEALGRAFVKRAFGDEGKAQTLAMVRAVEAAMQADLDTLPWMDAPTRKAALEKLHAVGNKIGYPDKWRSYDTLTVGSESYLANSEAAGEFETRRQLAKIGKPLDRSEWAMTPPTVNAYYDPSMNEMVFPAGILQPPFYARAARSSVNFGAIGLVMGHELSHGFDDEGRQFDGKGNLTEWWSPPVGQEFEKRAQCVVDQYNGFVAVDDLKLNGKLTLGENIADLGGLKLAWNAYRTGRGRSAPPRAGAFTDEQLFFIGYAQSWCEKRRDEYARMLVTVDSHSPGRYRVNGPLSNFKPFAEAFQCQSGAKMVNANACEVW